jgi:hypothetical protein
MKDMLRYLARLTIPAIDLLMIIPLFFAAIVMKTFRRIGAGRMPLCKSILMYVGVFPIREHYYEPLFNPKHLMHPLDEDRLLPGVDLNVKGQLGLLNQLDYAAELIDRWTKPGIPPIFSISNGSFEAGDAEYWYSIIRHFKPRRIIEIGSGCSTLVAMQAITKNQEIDRAYSCKHICVEPYEAPWLEANGVEVVRNKVEDLDLRFFSELDMNDILFIDSSHIIRPQGDVITEFLKILPTLKAGVIVHVHDIFTPKDYSRAAIVGEVSFWNEQYLLEAFLTQNDSWEIMGSLNYLQHHHYGDLKKVCPYLEPSREPGSFYLRRINS